jgi:hypothetical protein
MREHVPLSAALLDGTQKTKKLFLAVFCFSFRESKYQKLFRHTGAPGMYYFFFFQPCLPCGTF